MTALLCQSCEYKELNFKIISAGKNFTEVQQNQNIPRDAQNAEAIFLSDLVFEKTHAENGQ